jgi:hypothetical protein
MLMRMLNYGVGKTTLATEFRKLGFGYHKGTKMPEWWPATSLQARHRITTGDAGRLVVLKIVKYDLRDVGARGGEVAPSPEMPPPGALAQVPSAPDVMSVSETRRAKAGSL